MSHHIKIKKGLNIKLLGEAEKVISTAPMPETCALQPPDFFSLVPRLDVKEGDEVLAGTPLFSSKKNEQIKFCSPVSGEVAEIVRGEKRSVLAIKVLTDKQIRYVQYNRVNLTTASREEILNRLLTSGTWPFIRQRPFGIVANPSDKPKSIFISAFDTNPLAPDYNLVISDQVNFQAGLTALKKLTDGKVCVSVHEALTTSKIFTSAKDVEVNTFSGPHPSGNVGVQIHHLDPVNKGEVVWYLNAHDVSIIGKLLNEGVFDASRVIAVAGSQVDRPKYYKAFIGTSIKSILNDAGLKKGENRIISGNVLSGKRIDSDSYLGFYDTQLTVVPEGNEPEFMGWLAPGFEKFSMSRTFFSWLNPEKKYNPDTNLHGEERPFVITGQYEEVLPMDIYPMQLLKSILIEDIELMENLGIYEVVEEDFALCEFVCTSKIESQRIIRKGIDLVMKS
jgi:Na+-transporting NADH:ubiquinone oxidoreductase subunit A